MKALIETRDTRTERVFLVGVELKSRTGSGLRDSLDELAELATSAGGKVIGVTPQLFIDKGIGDESCDELICTPGMRLTRSMARRWKRVPTSSYSPRTTRGTRTPRSSPMTCSVG